MLRGKLGSENNKLGAKLTRLKDSLHPLDDDSAVLILDE